MKKSGGIRIKGVWIPVTVILLLLIFYYTLDPASSEFMPKCIFHSVTGLNCPGCGSQRFLHSILHGDLYGAARSNLLLLVAGPYLLFWMWVEVVGRADVTDVSYVSDEAGGNYRHNGRNRIERIRQRLNSPVAIVIICTVITIWMIVRNLPVYPYK